MPRVRAYVTAYDIYSAPPDRAGEAIDRRLREKGLLPPYTQVSCPPGVADFESVVWFEGELNPCFVVED